jgi:hypothetical protein
VTVLATITANGDSADFTVGDASHLHFSGTFAGARLTVLAKVDSALAPCAAPWSASVQENTTWERLRPVGQPLCIDEPLFVSLDGYTGMVLVFRVENAGLSTSIVVSRVGGGT